MSSRWKRSVLLLALTVLGVVVVASAASAQLLEGSSLSGPSQAGKTLTIYGMGGRDDVAQGRLDIANKVIENTGAKVDNPVNGVQRPGLPRAPRRAGHPGPGLHGPRQHRHVRRP